MSDCAHSNCCITNHHSSKILSHSLCFSKKNKIKNQFLISQLWPSRCKNRLSKKLKFTRYEMKIGHRRRGFNYGLIYLYMIQSCVYSVWRGTDGRALCSRAVQHTNLAQLDFIQQWKIWPSSAGLKEKSVFSVVY